MWRKVHFWVGLIIFVQVLFWIVSGIGFSVIYDRALGGERQTRNLEPAPVSVSDVQVTADRIPSLLRSRLGDAAIATSVSLQSHGFDGRPVYVVAMQGSDAPAVIDAKTGSWVEALSAEEAQIIAQRDFTGDAPVGSVEAITRPFQKGYDYFGQLPVYRVNFSNWKGTRIYVSPHTGEIRLRRNVDKTMFDVFWTLHMFGYVDRSIPGNVALIATGVISMISVLSGITMYGPHLKRKIRNGRSTRT